MSANSDAPVFARIPTGATGKLIDVGAGGSSAFSVDQAGNVIANGNLTVSGKLSSGPGSNAVGGAPPVTSGLDAHLTSATVSGNDESGIITLVFDGTGSSASVPLCTVTFANATLYAVTPVVILTNQTQGIASTTLYAGSFGAVSVGATSFKVVNGVSASTASSTYVVGYQVSGRG